MYLYVELWEAKKAWVELTTDQRKAKLDELMQEAKQNPITGVIPISVREIGDIVMFDGVKETPAIVNDKVARPTGFRYISAYMIPTVELIHKFEKRVENLGWWFDYFHQQNAWGEMDIEAAVSDMVSAGQSSAHEPCKTGAEKPGAEKPGAEKPGYVARFKAMEDRYDEMKADLKKVIQLLEKKTG